MKGRRRKKRHCHCCLSHGSNGSTVHWDKMLFSTFVLLLPYSLPPPYDSCCPHPGPPPGVSRGEQVTPSSQTSQTMAAHTKRRHGCAPGGSSGRLCAPWVPFTWGQSPQDSLTGPGKGPAEPPRGGGGGRAQASTWACDLGSRTGKDTVGVGGSELVAGVLCLLCCGRPEWTRPSLKGLTQRPSGAEGHCQRVFCGQKHRSVFTTLYHPSECGGGAYWERGHESAHLSRTHLCRFSRTVSSQLTRPGGCVRSCQSRPQPG